MKIWSCFTANNSVVIEERRDGKYVVTSGCRWTSSDNDFCEVFPTIDEALRRAGYPIDIAEELGIPRIPKELQ